MEVNKMNVYQKLQKSRVELQSQGLKQSGKNSFAKFSYFELSDFVPAVDRIMMNNGLCTVINYGETEATLTVINCDKPEETIVFNCPVCEVEIKGSNKIQALGGMQTYVRRYLFYSAMNIVECDFLDAISGKDQAKGQSNNGNMGHYTNGYRGASNSNVKAVEGAIDKADSTKKRTTSQTTPTSEEINLLFEKCIKTNKLNVEQVMPLLESNYKVKDVKDLTDSQRALLGRRLVATLKRQ